MWRTDDPLADFDRWDAAQARAEARLPRCDDCGKRITDRFYLINGDYICADCMEANYGKDVDDFT